MVRNMKITVLFYNHLSFSLCSINQRFYKQDRTARITRLKFLSRGHLDAVKNDGGFDLVTVSWRSNLSIVGRIVGHLSSKHNCWLLSFSIAIASTNYFLVFCWNQV